MGGPGAGIAYGMQALNNHVNRSVINQLRAQDAAGITSPQP